MAYDLDERAKSTLTLLVTSFSLSDTKRHGYKVSVKNLNSWFGSKQALKDINFDVKENTITALIGPSGIWQNDTHSLFEPHE